MPFTPTYGVLKADLRKSCIIFGFVQVSDEIIPFNLFLRPFSLLGTSGPVFFSAHPCDDYCCEHTFNVSETN